MKAIGIDLGTTNSIVAGKKIGVEFFADETGEVLLPSFVAFSNKKKEGEKVNAPLVGQCAKDFQKYNPQNTFFNVKRLIGRNFEEAEVQNIISNNLVSYVIKSFGKLKKGTVCLEVSTQEGQTEFFPEDLSSLILKKLIERVPEAKEIEKVVLTVPAYFNDRQKHATKVAAAKAGIPKCHLISEPTVAAISFGLSELEGKGSQNVLVFDFGGGTLDISALSIGGQNIVELGKIGDMWLGGVDIDEQILGWVLDQAKQQEDYDFASQLHKMDVEKRMFCLSQLRSMSEEVKISLSTKLSQPFFISGMFEDDGVPVDTSIEVTREHLEALLASKMDKIRKLISQLLSDLIMKADDFDAVLMVGGSSQIPLVKTTLCQIFPENIVRLHERPMLAIAEGAAIAASLVEDSFSKANIFISAAHDYYLDNPMGDEPVLLISRNTPLPAKKALSMRTISDSQMLLNFRFLNQYESYSDEVGKVWLNIKDVDFLDKDADKDATDEKRGIEFVFEFAINEDNLISVTCKNEKTKKAIVSQVSRGKHDSMWYDKVARFVEKANKSDKLNNRFEAEEQISSLVPKINQVIHPQTEDLNEVIEDQISTKFKFAEDTFRNNLCPSLQYYFTKSVINKIASNESSSGVARDSYKEHKQKLNEVKRLLDCGLGTSKELVNQLDDLNIKLKEDFPDDLFESEKEVILGEAMRYGLLEDLMEVFESGDEKVCKKFGDKLKRALRNDKSVMDTGFQLN